jgi:hypothetical protein
LSFLRRIKVRGNLQQELIPHVGIPAKAGIYFV